MPFPEIKLDRTTGIPVYQQIRNIVVSFIETGQVQPGDQLPSIRRLATALVVAPNTIIKAYDELDREGFVELKMGSGSFIKSTLDGDTKKYQVMRELLYPMMYMLRGQGFNKSEMRRAFESNLSDIFPDS